jgi:hypothetical protein
MSQNKIPISGQKPEVKKQISRRFVKHSGATITGNSFSEALILASTNPQYNK